MKRINLKMAVAFVCGSYFLIASILIHFLRPDLSFVSDPLSRFAVGDSSLLLTIGFLAIGICEVLIGINDKQIRLGSALIIVAGISVIIVALIKMDAGNAITIQGQIHNWAALSEFTWFPLAAFFITRRKKPGILKTYSLFTAVITLAIMVILVVLFNLKMMSFFGSIQKINILAITSWLIIYSGSKAAIENKE